MSKKQLHTAGLVVVANKKLLLAFSKNKKAWYLPGGKVHYGETAQQCLVREIKEELNVDIAANELQFYCHITAPAFGEAGLIMEQDCYRYNLKETPQPGNEIGAVDYFDLQSYQQQPQQVPGVLLVFKYLLQDHLADKA